MPCAHPGSTVQGDRRNLIQPSPVTRKTSRVTRATFPLFLSLILSVPPAMPW